MRFREGGCWPGWRWSRRWRASSSTRWGRCSHCRMRRLMRASRCGVPARPRRALSSSLLTTTPWGASTPSFLFRAPIYAHLLDVLHRANPRLIGLDLQFIGTSSRPLQDRTLLSAFSRDGPVLVSVTDSGTGVPTIAGASNPQGVVPASGAVDTDGDGVLRKLMDIQVHLQTFAIRAAEMVDRRPIPAAQIPDNHGWIDFAGPPGTYRTYSMARGARR